MSFDDHSVLGKLALLVMYAEDMHRDATTVAHKTVPEIDARLEADFDVVAFLTAHDAIMPPPGVKLPMNIKSEAVYYGFLARRKDDPSKWIVGVRGTAGVAEWIIDGQFLWVPHPRVPGCHVEHGFWDIYGSMALIGLDGAVIDHDAAAGICAKVGGDTVTVIGHSLGSALATYLTFDLATRLGDRASACLFASPRTGDPAWVAAFDRLVKSYIVVNYVLDLVPYLPTRPAYATLGKVLILEPSTAEASVRLDVGCNHHVICYCAMLSYAVFTAAVLDPALDLPLRVCVIGDKTTITLEAKSMAVAVQAVADTPLHVSALFRGMFALNLI